MASETVRASRKDDRKRHAMRVDSKVRTHVESAIAREARHGLGVQLYLNQALRFLVARGARCRCSAVPETSPISEDTAESTSKAAAGGAIYVDDFVRATIDTEILKAAREDALAVRLTPSQMLQILVARGLRCTGGCARRDGQKASEAA